MTNWLPNWDTSEWAAVVSAVAAATAAIAAAASARASLKLQRAGRAPHVSAGVIHSRDTGRIRLTFANSGPVVATQLAYYLFVDGRKASGYVDDGQLTAGQKVHVDPDIVSANFKDNAYLVWSWRDADDNVHQRSNHWKYIYVSRRKFLRKKDKTMVALFREMYPNIDVS